MLHVQTSNKNYILRFSALLCFLVIIFTVQVNAFTPSAYTYVWTNSRINTSSTASTSKYDGYISGEEYRLTGQQKSNGGQLWYQISYKTSKGNKTSWALANLILDDVNYKAYTVRVSNQKHTTYKGYGSGSASYGSVQNEDVIVIGPAKNGRHQILYNVPGGKKITYIDAKAVEKISKKAPIGCLDEVTVQSDGRVLVRGWTFAPDASSQSVKIHVYLNSTFIAEINANQARPDVNKAYGISGNHGFSAYLQINRSGNVNVYTINPYDSGNNPLIGSKYLNISNPTTTTWRYPMNNYKITQSFGHTTSSPPAPNRTHHAGTDIVSYTDTSIFAAASGVVKATGYNTANGNYVVIQHTLSGKTVYSFYAHMLNNSICVKNGQSVSAGTKIGVMGNTGRSFGSHLHFAVSDSLNSSGGYVGYIPSFSGNKSTYNNITFYNPSYIITNSKLP